MSERRNILIFENTHTLSDTLVKKWVEMAEESIRLRGRFCVALSGGRSSVEFYCKLANLQDFELWEKTHIFFADERHIDQDDQKNHYRIVKENLLDYVNIPQANVHPVDVSFRHVEVVAEQYKQALVEFLSTNEEGFPQFDLVMLGIGEDGSVASLFPGTSSAEELKSIVVPVSENFLKEERVSISLPVINSSKNIVIIAAGAHKAGIIKSIIEENNTEAPAAKIFSWNGSLYYYIDQTAAQLLENKALYAYRDQASFL